MRKDRFTLDHLLYDLSDVFDRYLVPEAYDVHARREFSTMVEYEERHHDGTVRKVAPVFPLVCSRDTETFLHVDAVHYANAYMKSLPLMARVYNRCVQNGWLIRGTLRRFCMTPEMVPGRLVIRYHLMVWTASPFFNVMDLNAKLGERLFVCEEEPADDEAWNRYERAEELRRKEAGGTLPEDVNPLAITSMPIDEALVNYRRGG